MRSSLQQQRGHAAILFAIALPALFGLFVLATDGAYALQAKARIDNATEVAALALSAKDASNKDSAGAGSGSAVNRKIATDYIGAYMGDRTKVKNLRITRLECEQIPECKAGIKKGEQRYIQFNVRADYDHATFFTSGDPASGFDGKVTVSSAATSQKFEGDAVDIIYAADFSGSMNKGWSGGNKSKVEDLKDIIVEVNEKLKDYNDKNNRKYVNTVGIIPFRSAIKAKIRGTNRYCEMSQLVRKSKRYSWEKLRPHEINYSKTAKQIFVEKGSSNCVHQPNWARDKEVELTTNFSDFNSKLNGFVAHWGTASYQAIIRGAQLLKDGKNARRLIIILSDGADSNIANINNATVHQKLVDLGYCDTIRKELSKGKTKDGRKIKAKIAAIGFAYDAEKNRALKECVGADNLYKAENKAEIKSKILDLITEEIGHLK
ncbi:TadE/TadG family type IV pilus assembly protein [Vibrio penaeicida]|uniref:TadE/TadG family type IV pilus assembly protein n=1 Tax=Vibrio penaeicida TaxID=104609 RepID=UPI001CC54307|nr:TadE/TadG family type IV pilus assembly protein [Vibrio penaeicida]